MPQVGRKGARRAVRGAPLAFLVALVVSVAAAKVLRVKGTANPPHGSTAGVGVPRSPAAVRPSLAALGPAPTAAPPTVGAGARMLHGDRRRTGRAASRGPKADKLAWTYEADGPIEAQVTTSPDEATLYVATLGGSLVALSRDGHERWTVALGGRAYGAPCVAGDGTIYVGSDARRFFAVAPDGHTRWKMDTNGEADTAPLLARDGTLVFAAGSTVFSVRPSGEVAWRFTAQGKVFTAPAQSDDGLIVFGSQDDRAYGLSSTGALLWSTDLGADVDGSPAIDDDGAIYFGTDGDEIVRVDGKGNVLGRTPVGGYVRGSLSIARNGDVLAGVYGPTPRVVRVTPQGGVRGWFAVQGTGAREFGVHGGPLEDGDGTLYFGAQDDAVYAISGVTGEVLWKHLTGDDVDAPAALLSDGTLVVASDDHRVYAFQPQQ